jgi:penicillin-binding protein 1B
MRDPIKSGYGRKDLATVTRRPRTQVIKREVEPRRGLLRRIFNRYVLIALAVLLVAAGSVFGYFYTKYSAVIDARLRGDVLIRTTRMYAAPRPIRSGSGATLQSIKSHLDSIGYVESTKEADASRGRYQIKGNSIEIRVSSNAIIDRIQRFPNMTVSFGAGGRGINRISDLDTRRNYDQTELEPGLLTEVSSDKRQKQKIVSFKDLPKDFVNATLAIEDRQFFEHPGINVRGIFRALWRDVGEGETRQGGSSITQQLVKNFFLSPEKTVRRKAQEMMMAVVLETKLSKEQIFQLYSNEVYMGQSGSYSINGVGEAASTYFNKDVVNLTLPECAFIAGIIRGPSLYSPYRDLERAKARRNQVLDSMLESEFITREQAETAKATELKIQAKRSAMNTGAPYFIDYLQQQTATGLGGRDLSNQSFRIYTTIDLDLQHAADKAVNDTLQVLDKIFAKRKKDPVPPGTLQAALVALDAKTGDILAMVGGRDYGMSQLNRAVDAHRQPGSVFKPIVYTTALNTAYEEAGQDVITPASMFMDAPETFYYGNGTYSPENFGKVYSNKELPLREGLVHSLNVITVRVAEKVGYQHVARMAERLGLPRPQPFPALALGTAEATPLEVARAYTAFANNGNLVSTRPYTKVTNSEGAGITEEKPEVRQVLRPTISWLMTNAMQDVLNRGTAAGARRMGFIEKTAAGKTGTSRDGWFAGYTPNMVCVVWVGFDDNSELGLEGAKSALPIWAAFMKQALVIRPDLRADSFPQPDGIVTAEIDPETGMLATDSCPTHRPEYFIEGSQPVETCTLHSTGQPIPASSPTPEPWPEGKPDQSQARDSNKNKRADVDLANQQRPREVMPMPRPSDKLVDNANRNSRKQGNRAP